MKKGTIYEKATGRITMTIDAPDQNGVILQTLGREEELGFILDEKHDGAEFYIQAQQPVERPSMTLSVEGRVYLAVDEVLRVESIPEGVTVIHPYGSVVVDDGFIEWSCVEPGEYFLKFIKFPYKEVEINAVVS